MISSEGELRASQALKEVDHKSYFSVNSLVIAFSRYPCIFKQTVWCIPSPSLSGYSVVNQWLLSGYSVVIQWLLSAYSVVTQWLHSDYSVVTQWLISGYSVVT